MKPKQIWTNQIHAQPKFHQSVPTNWNRFHQSNHSIRMNPYNKSD